MKNTSLRRLVVLLTAFIVVMPLVADTPQDGKMYRLISKYYPTLAAAEDISTSGIVTRDIGDDSAFEQMWSFDASGTGFTLTNVLTGNAISSYGGQNNQYWTSTPDAAHTFQLAQPAAGYWNIRHSSSMGGLHAAWTGKVVYWHDNAADATQWQIEEVAHISEEQLALRQLVYRNYVDLTTHESSYNQRLKTFFTDESCSELLPTYASLSDDALRSAMSDLPNVFVQMALKIKNDAWEHREREFRIRSYKAYSDPDYWYTVLLTTRWGRINNPTGIYGNAGDIILVFVGDDIPSGATLQLEFIQGTDLQGSVVDLHKGLNVLTAAADHAMCYVQYIGTTSPDSPKLITDYPPIRIHIENGTVNGFWNMAEHTDADWVDILSHATAPVIDVKGEKVMYHMHTSVMRQNCPSGIHDAIDWWENMLHWQHDIMGIEDYVPQKCNNMACAITLDDDNTYMAATWYRTQYHVNVAYKILNFSTVVTDPDFCFGPAHENGHMNQGAVNIVGCTESSNGILENLIVWKIGKYLTRGPVNATMWNEYALHTPWPQRSNDNLLRLHWQLYLYFHECGVDTTFWPRVFKAMRTTPLPIRWGNKKEVTAADDMLLFARHCCDVAQMDLTDFFRVYGFLVPHEKMETRESGNFLTTPQSDIDAFVAYASRYPKAPPIEFIDDRIRPIPRTDGGEGNRLTYDFGPGQCGDVGLYTDFLLTSVHAQGYIYSRSGNTVTIKDGNGAVGFRIYDSITGELIYLSNSLKFTLPAPCQNSLLRIVAVSADGTECRIPSTAEAGTESEQLAALKASLTNAKALLDLSDATGSTVGSIFAFALRELQTLYDDASAAVSSADQSRHTYGQWSMLLDEAVYAVLANEEARVPVYSENTYALYMTVYKSYSLSYLASGPKGTTTDPTTQTAKWWLFEPAATPGQYYIKNVSNGLYITDIEANKRIRMQSYDVAQALPFTLQYNAKGTVSLFHEPTGLFLAHNGNKEAIGATTATQWRIVTLSDNHAIATEDRCQSLLRIAGYMSDELSSPDLYVLSEQFEAARQQFLHAYDVVQAIANGAADGRLDLRLNDLWESMETLSPLYVNPDKPFEYATPYPDDNPESYVKQYEGWYFYIQNLKTGAYAYYNDETGRYNGCLRMAPLTDADDKRFLFRIDVDADGNVYIRSACTQCPVALWTSYLDCSGSRTPVAFRITLDEALGGLLIGNDSGAWTVQTSTGATTYAQFRTKGTPWKFRRAVYLRTSSVAPLTDDTRQSTQAYDLMGRPATPGQGGILIVNGKKQLHPKR
ncbi:MAG: M60 family metallopeptidase [Bacteroidaceae bacterium]|nr:M60 family metallopeptidase [Bacteroidaceae bacterium]